MSIHTRITLLFVIFLLVMTAMVGLFFSIQFNSFLKQKSADNLAAVSRQFGMQMDNFLERLRYTTEYVCSDRDILSIIQTEELDVLQAINAVVDIKEQVTRSTHNSLSTALSIYGIILFLDDNLPFSKYLQQGTLAPGSTASNNVFNSARVQNYPWYRSTLRRDGEFFAFHSDDSDEGFIYMAKVLRPPVRAEYSQEPIGVIVYSFLLSELDRVFQRSLLTPRTQVYLVVDEDYIFYSTEKSEIGESFKLISIEERKRFTERENLRDLTIGSQEFQLYYEYLSQGSNMVVLMPREDLFQDKKIVLQIVTTVSSVIIVIGVLLSFIFSSVISNPLRKLSRVMHSVRDTEDFSKRLETSRHDEIGILYRSFNYLLCKVEDYITRVRDSVTQQKNSELRALQAQINPHFLYNALDTVSWMALSNGQKDIADSLSSIAAVTRYSIKDPNALVSIEMEITAIREYTRIQSLRNDFKFDLIIDFDDHFLAVLCPKLIIQPLVENSIIHGFTDKGDTVSENTIIISGYKREDESLEISVIDNGTGADVGELNRRLILESDKMPSEGLGIRSVHERIRLCFGEPYGLHFEENPEGGLTAVIQFPNKPHL